MRTVSRYEADLLLVLHCFMRRAPLEQALPILAGRCVKPRCLSREAVELAQDALAKGCTTLLARRGGWRPARYLRGDRIAAGRLWDRTSPADLGLAFSHQAMEFLMWVTASNPTATRDQWRAAPDDLSPGDRLLCFFAYEALRATEFAPALRQLAAFARHGLCWLAFPEDFADNPECPEMTPWVGGVGACVLEALETTLAEGWLQVERRKGKVSSWQRMRAVGGAQEIVLATFLDAADRNGRRDLARFLLHAAARLLDNAPSSRAWVGALELQGLRLADRTDAYRAAMVFLRMLDRLQQWERQARTVAFYDEDYAASQLWKADWQALEADSLVERAQAVARELEPLST
jgi:hypothetical protein